MLSTLSPAVLASPTAAECIPVSFSAITPETVGIRAGSVLLGLVHGETASREAADIWIADIADPRLLSDPAAWVFRDEPFSNHRLKPEARRIAQPMLRFCGVLATKIRPTPAPQDPLTTTRRFPTDRHRITTRVAGRVPVLNYWHATRLRVGDRLGFVVIRPPDNPTNPQIVVFAVRQSCPDLVVDAMIDGRKDTWESLYTAMHKEATRFTDEFWTQHVLGTAAVDLHFFIIGRVARCRYQSSDRQFAQVDPELMAASEDIVIVSLARKDSSVYTRPKLRDAHTTSDARADAGAGTGSMPFHHTRADPVRINVGQLQFDTHRRATDESKVAREAIDEVHFRRGLFRDFNESGWRQSCELWINHDAPTYGASLLDKVEILFPEAHRAALEQANYNSPDPDKIRLLYRHELPWNGILFFGRDDSDTKGIIIERDGSVRPSIVVPGDEHGRLYTQILKSDERDREKDRLSQQAPQAP